MGAIDINACPRGPRKYHPCRCAPCITCGFGKHTAVHGPVLGQPPGTKPWGHEYDTGEYQ